MYNLSLKPWASIFCCIFLVIWNERCSILPFVSEGMTCYALDHQAERKTSPVWQTPESLSSLSPLPWYTRMSRHLPLPVHQLWWTWCQQYSGPEGYVWWTSGYPEDRDPLGWHYNKEQGSWCHSGQDHKCEQMSGTPLDPSFFFYYLFIFGCTGSSLLCMGVFFLVAASGGYSCSGFSLWCLLLWSTGSRRLGFSCCGAWA